MKPKEETMQLENPPKYKVGDLVLRGHGIVLKIHEKADYKKAYYLVHDIQTGDDVWLKEPIIEMNEQLVLELYRGVDEVQDHYDE